MLQARTHRRLRNIDTVPRNSRTTQISLLMQSFPQAGWSWNSVRGPTLTNCLRLAWRRGSFSPLASWSC